MHAATPPSRVLCAFANARAQLPDPRDPRGRHVLPVLLGTLPVALAGGADTLAAVTAFRHDHQAWFRRWRPLGKDTPSRDTCLRWMHRLEPETAMQAALRLPGDQPARPAAAAPGLGRPLHLADAFRVREG